MEGARLSLPGGTAMTSTPSPPPHTHTAASQEPNLAAWASGSRFCLVDGRIRGCSRFQLETSGGRNERGKGVTCDLNMPRWPLGLVRARAKRLFVPTAVGSSKHDGSVT